MTPIDVVKVGSHRISRLHLSTNIRSTDTNPSGPLSEGPEYAPGGQEHSGEVGGSNVYIQSFVLVC